MGERDSSLGRAVWGAAVAIALGGCAASGPDERLIADVSAGQYGFARTHLLESEPRGEFTDLMHLGMVNLADGLAPESEVVFNRLYELLRMRGVNKDTRLAATVTHEGVKVFRGEPFEQAMAYHYVAVQKAIVGDWGNVRAAAIGGLELLDEFDDLRYSRGGGSGGHEYAVQDADFALGYLMAGLGSVGLGRIEEAADYFSRANELSPGLEQTTEPVLDGSANAVMIVDYGLGPIKLGEGASGSAEVFRPRFSSDSRPLVVFQEGLRVAFAPVQDLNRMAWDYAWDDLRDVRAAKAVLGDGLLVGGAVVAASSENTEGALVGLGLIGLGLIAKATSHADTRQIDTLSQRTYFVPVRLPERAGPLSIAVEGDSGSRLTLPWVRPAREGERLRVMYVRLDSGSQRRGWAAAGPPKYFSDANPPAIPMLPYILGGRDVRTPSADVVRDYHAAGLPASMTSEDVRELYRMEGIRIGTDASRGLVGRHVLEGGSWLFTPTPESTGFARLFASEHPAYRARTERVGELAREIGERRTALLGQPEP